MHPNSFSIITVASSFVKFYTNAGSIYIYELQACLCQSPSYPLRITFSRPRHILLEMDVAPKKIQIMSGLQMDLMKLVKAPEECN